MSASVSTKLESTGFGSGPFGATELESLSGLIQECPWRRLALPADHPVYRRLKETFQQSDESCRDWTETMKLSLELLSSLSLANENIASCTELLGDVAAQLDRFVSLHLKPTGRSEDDEILSALLTLLINVSGKKLAGIDVLEMVNGKISAAVAAFTNVFRSYHRRLPIQRMLEIPTWKDDAAFLVSACRSLYELALSQTLYLRFEGDQTTDRSMVQLDEEFKTYMTSFNKATMQVPVFDYVGGILDAWFDTIERAENVEALQLLPYFQSALKYTLQLISNMLTTTTQFSGQIKNHVAKNTRIIQNVALPYILFATDILDRGAYDPDTVRDQHIVPLALVIRVVSLVSYKIKMFRPWLRRFPLFGTRLARNKTVLESDLNIEFFALVVRFIINAELTDCIPDVLDVWRNKFDATQKSLIAARLTSKKEKMYPINVFVPTYTQLREIFEAPKVGVGETTSSPKFNFSFEAEQKLGGTTGGRRRGHGKGRHGRHQHRPNQRQRMRMRSKYMKMRAAVGPLPQSDELPAEAEYFSASSGGYRADIGDSDGEGDFTSPDETIPVEVTKLPPSAVLSAADEAFEKRGSIPIGDDYVAGGETKLATEGKAAVNPEKGQTKRWFGLRDDTDESDTESGDVDEDSSSDFDPSGAEQQQQQQAGSAGTSTGTGVIHVSATREGMQPPTTATTGTTTTTDAAPTASTGPTGAVPSDMISPSGIDLSPWRRTAPYGVPKQYLCALSRKLINIPVLSPNGDVFDKATILDFLKKNKRVCPVTGDTLYPSDLVVDNSLRREIDAVRGNYSY